jgi:hypothetical protein
MEMRIPTSQNMPFSFGNKPVTTISGLANTNAVRQPSSQSLLGSTPGLGCIMKPPQNLTNIESNADSEDDFPICQASLPNPNAIPLSTNCIPQFGKPGMGIGMQFGQTKSNQMLFSHLKNMRAQVEQVNMMIDSLYQILTQPHVLNEKQVEQIHTQINTMRDSILVNNKSINEIYRIMST